MLWFVLGTLRRTLHRWYAARDSAIVARLKFERAVVRHNNHLLSTSFTRWREYVALSQRKQLLRRQCVWLLETRLVASHFLQWRVEFTSRQHENSQTISALWHWSVVLQHKVCLLLTDYVCRRLHMSVSSCMVQFRICIHVFRCVNNVAPDTCPHSTNPSLMFLTTGTCTCPVMVHGGRAFAYTGLSIWNSLPGNLKDKNLSLPSSKRHLKTFLLLFLLACVACLEFCALLLL